MKKILILGGGFSKERAISLVTSKSVLKALKKKEAEENQLLQTKKKSVIMETLEEIN